MRHLDDLLYRQALHHPEKLSEEARAHLQSGCEECAEYLLERESVDALDGQVDALLLPDRPAQAPRGEFERILAALPAQPAPRSAPWWGAAAALVGVLLLGILAHPLRPPPVDEGFKGLAPLTVETRFAVVRPGGRVEPGVAGTTLPAEGAVSLRLELSRAAHVGLVRLDAQGAEVLLEDAALPAGRSDLRQGEQLVGVPLKGLSGEERLVVVASDAPLGEAALLQAARGGKVEGAVVGGVAFKVAP